MKKIIPLFLAGILLGPCSASFAAVTRHHIAVTGDWQKSATGIWKGANNAQFKRDAKSGNIMISTDGRTWLVSNGTWTDKDGKTIKIMDGILQWSTTANGPWSQVPEWKWQGADGNWYKFDKDWSLWTLTAKTTDSKSGN